MNHSISAQDVLSLLPQTQCGQCGHAKGCLPYAKAVANGQDPENLCVPGGQAIANQLAELLGTEPKPVQPSKYPTNPKTNRPVDLVATIIEDQCIGCFKCVSCCPVDAILGAPKTMHVVIEDECTGCELCLPACPVDCIELKPAASKPLNEKLISHRQQRYHRFLDRQAAQVDSRPILSETRSRAADVSFNLGNPAARIKAARLRSQIKKLSLQVGQEAQIETLSQELSQIEQGS